MATLYYSQHTLSTASATEEAAGYAATNLGLRSIVQAWRSTTTGSNVITLDFGSDKTMAGILLQASNLGAATVGSATAAAYPTFTARGTVTHGVEDNNRRKAILALSGITARYLRVTTPGGGSPQDGSAYWSVGTVYAWASSETVTPGPELGISQSFDLPRITRRLTNGRTAVASTGSPFSRISFEFREKRGTESVRNLVYQMLTGICGLTLGYSNQPELCWPLEIVAEEISRDLPEIVFSSLNLELCEAV